jgi:hypothetical protein
MSNILKSILSEMLDAAEKTPGEPVRRPLSPRESHSRRGLQVDVKIKNGKTYLQISRSNQWPDDNEWQYVLKSWPYPVMVQPTQASVLRLRKPAPANTCEPNGQPNPA